MTVADATAPPAIPVLSEAQKAEQTRIGDAVTALIAKDSDGNITPLGQAVFALVVTEIGNERARCVKLVQEIATSSTRAARQAEGAAESARITGNPEAYGQAKAGVAQASVLAMALMGVSNVLALTPGECKACGGSKLSRSRLNPNHLVACEVCKPKEATT